MHQYDLVPLPPNFHHSSYFKPTNSKSKCLCYLLLHTVGASSTGADPAAVVGVDENRTVPSLQNSNSEPNAQNIAQAENTPVGHNMDNSQLQSK